MLHITISDSKTFEFVSDLILKSFILFGALIFIDLILILSRLGVCVSTAAANC